MDEVKSNISGDVQASGSGAADTTKSGSIPRGLPIIVGAVVLFLIVAGVAIVVILNYLTGQADPAQDNVVAEVSESAQATPAPVPEPIVEPAPIASTEIFTFRDIFQPVLRPRVATPGVDATATLQPDVLYLLNIVVEDGVQKAVLQLNEVAHTLAQGEAIAGTPWQVRTIADGSVVMTYGDAPVTLSIGHGVIADETVPGVMTPVAK